MAIGPQLAIGVELVVVEVADGGQRDRIGLVEDRVVVEQPLLVAADLDRWVEDAPDLLADVQLDAVVGRRRTDAPVAPLLELDDDRVFGARRRVAGEHRVEPPARVAELVLEDDAVVVQLGLVDEHRQRHEAVLPARHLARRRPVPDLRRVLGPQLLRDPMHLRIRPKLLSRPGVKLHGVMPSTSIGTAQLATRSHRPTNISPITADLSSQTPSACIGDRLANLLSGRLRWRLRADIFSLGQLLGRLTMLVYSPAPAGRRWLSLDDIGGSMPTALVIHGASNRSRDEWRGRVARLEKRMGDGWNLIPIWWGTAGVDLDLVKAGLPYLMPPRPGWRDESAGEEFWGPSIAEAQANGSLAADEGGGGPDDVGERVAWDAKRLVLTNTSGIAADVLMYWHRRSEIQEDVLEEIAKHISQPNVVAHSLGAIISLDLVLSGALKIGGLVTFGTPVSAIHVFDPTRNRLPPFKPSDGPVTVSGIQRWTNLWNHYDPIAFVAGEVFRLENGPVVDGEAPLPDGTPIGMAHDAYFQSRELLSAIANTCL